MQVGGREVSVGGGGVTDSGGSVVVVVVVVGDVRASEGEGEGVLCDELMRLSWCKRASERASKLQMSALQLAASVVLQRESREREREDSKRVPNLPHAKSKVSYDDACCWWLELETLGTLFSRTPRPTRFCSSAMGSFSSHHHTEEDGRWKGQLLISAACLIQPNVYAHRRHSISSH